MIVTDRQMDEHWQLILYCLLHSCQNYILYSVQCFSSWGHSGYKDLYPEEFIAKLPVDEEQSDKRRKRKQGKSKSVKRKKKKKHKKKDKVKMIEVSNCEQKKLKTKNKKCMNKSDSSSDEDFDTEDTDSSEHKTKDRHLMSASQRSEMCLKEQDSGDSETSIDALRRKRQKTSHQEFGICDSGEEVRSNESKQYRKHRLSRARTKMDQQKKTRLKLPSDQIDRYSKERKAIKSD